MIKRKAVKIENITMENMMIIKNKMAFKKITYICLSVWSISFTMEVKAMDIPRMERDFQKVIARPIHNYVRDGVEDTLAAIRKGAVHTRTLGNPRLEDRMDFFLEKFIKHINRDIIRPILEGIEDIIEYFDKLLN